ncbi:MAG: hypothetical protein ACT4SY_05605 [Hyphomicrobiales bacterium]
MPLARHRGLRGACLSSQPAIRAAGEGRDDSAGEDEFRRIDGADHEARMGADLKQAMAG